MENYTEARFVYVALAILFFVNLFTVEMAILSYLQQILLDSLSLVSVKIRQKEKKSLIFNWLFISDSYGASAK